MQVRTIPHYPRSDVHVVPADGLWAIKQEHLPRYTRLFATQYEAIGHAARYARDGASLLVIHGADGRFRDVRSYS